MLAFREARALVHLIFAKYLWKAEEMSVFHCKSLRALQRRALMEDCAASG